MGGVQNDGPNLYQKKNRKILENGVKIHHKSEEMVPRSLPKATSEASRRNVIRPEKSGEHFWRHLGDFGRPMAQLGVRGCTQNQVFWYQVAPKYQKMRPRMRHQKIYEILIEI